MTDLIGTPTELTVSISRKIWTEGTKGSLEVVAGLTVNLPPEVNLEQAFDAADAWLTASVAKSIAEKQVDIAVSQPAPVAQHKPSNDGEGRYGNEVEVQRVPVVGDSETEVFEVIGYVIEYAPTGQKSLKVKGGKYSKFGVKVWPEIAQQNAQLSDWETKDPGEYTIVGHLSAIVLLDGGKAKKVIGWR